MLIVSLGRGEMGNTIHTVISAPDTRLTESYTDMSTKLSSETERERERCSTMFRAMVHEIPIERYKYLIVKLYFTCICSISWVVFKWWAMVEEDGILQSGCCGG